jgi:hypothetical protein
LRCQCYCADGDKPRSNDAVSLLTKPSLRAKQYSFRRRKKLDCVVAFALRNDVERQAEELTFVVG